MEKASGAFMCVLKMGLYVCQCLFLVVPNLIDVLLDICDAYFTEIKCPNKQSTNK